MPSSRRACRTYLKAARYPGEIDVQQIRGRWGPVRARSSDETQGLLIKVHTSYQRAVGIEDNLSSPALRGRGKAPARRAGKVRGSAAHESNLWRIDIMPARLTNASCGIRAGVFVGWASAHHASGARLWWAEAHPTAARALQRSMVSCTGIRYRNTGGASENLPLEIGSPTP